jgi:hypothetical protein
MRLAAFNASSLQSKLGGCRRNHSQQCTMKLFNGHFLGQKGATGFSSTTSTIPFTPKIDLAFQHVLSAWRQSSVTRACVPIFERQSCCSPGDKLRLGNIPGLVAPVTGRD